MTIQLVDSNPKMCIEWSREFHDCADVVIHNGDFFSLKTDCVVSPANSFGFMDGGLDLHISKKLGWSVQKRLQEKIRSEFNGELLVGQVAGIITLSDEVPFVISAPTMRVPMILPKDSVNVYLAAKAIFKYIKIHPIIQVVTIPGLGTGVGQVPFDVCARQMRAAYNYIFLFKERFPETWNQAQADHQRLYTGEIRDLQRK
jgi:O-acetyl-ADP-ribose deacetylase (regulator of RNase III)